MRVGRLHRPAKNLMGIRGTRRDAVCRAAQWLKSSLPKERRKRSDRLKHAHRAILRLPGYRGGPLLRPRSRRHLKERLGGFERSGGSGPAAPSWMSVGGAPDGTKRRPPGPDGSGLEGEVRNRPWDKGDDESADEHRTTDQVRYGPRTGIAGPCERGLAWAPWGLGREYIQTRAFRPPPPLSVKLAGPPRKPKAGSASKGVDLSSENCARRRYLERPRAAVSGRPGTGWKDGFRSRRARSGGRARQDAAKA